MKYFFTLLLTISIVFSSAQVSITGNRLEKDGRSYKFGQYQEVFTNEQAKKYFKRARTNVTVGTIIAGTGGALLGFSVAKALTVPKEVSFPDPFGGYYTVEGDRKMWWGYAGLGAGIALVSIPFAIKASKNSEKAIKLENEEITASKSYFKLESSGAGLALSYHF